MFRIQVQKSQDQLTSRRHLHTNEPMRRTLHKVMRLGTYFFYLTAVLPQHQFSLIQL